MGVQTAVLLYSLGLPTEYNVGNLMLKIKHALLYHINYFFNINLSMDQTSPWQHMRDGSPLFNFLETYIINTIEL